MDIKTVAAVFMIIALSSCKMLRENRFEITNKTGHNLKEIQVFFADASIERQSLSPGEKLSFHPSPEHDGGISISYLENGNRVKHELGYAAPPISMTCEFQIVDNDIRGDCN